jgi:hypothetical protein
MAYNVVPIVDHHECSKLEELIKPLLESPAHLNPAWVKQHGWVAVPVESAAHFANEDASRLAKAMQAAAVLSCFAAATEPLENFPHCFTVDATTEGLLAFSRECAHFNFLLSPASLSFAVLCTVFDYFIVAGPQAFVENALGCDIDKARARFLEYASNSGDFERLVKVLRHYE